MSGGHFNYQQYRLRDIADEIATIVDNNDSKKLDEDGYPLGRGYPPPVIEKFTEAVKTLRRAEIMAHRIDWLLSGDDGEETFLERLEKDLKAFDDSFKRPPGKPLMEED